MLKNKKLTILLITVFFILFIIIFLILNKNEQKNKTKELFLEKPNIDFNSLSQEDE